MARKKKIDVPKVEEENINAHIIGAGDVVDKTLRQVVTATSDGSIAALQAIRYLDSQ